MAGESTNNGAYLKLNPLEIVHVDTSKLKYIEPPDINLPDQCPGSYITSLSIAGNAKSLAVGDDCGRLFFSRWEPASNSWLPLTASKFKAGDYGTVQEGRPPAITTLRFNADGARVAAGISNGQLWLFDGPDRDAAPLIRYDKDEQTTDLNFSPNSRVLARATGTTVRVIALPPIKQKGEIDGSVPVENYPPLAFHDIIRTLSFSDDGRYLSVIGVKGDVKVYPTRSLPQKRTFIEWLERTFVSTYNVVKPPISSVEYFKLRDSRNAPLAIYDVRLLAEGHLEVLGDNKRVWAESEESGEQVLALSEHDLNLENRATKICKSLGDDLPDAGISRAAVCLSMPVVISWLFWSSLAKQLRFAV
jgi:WD40 repeat protein